MPVSNYYIEDEFNSYINKIRPRFSRSVFHLNFNSLNCHHKELIAYLHLLNLRFDCICLSEVWSTNLKSYQSIFQDYMRCFVKSIDNNVGGVAMFVKNDYKCLVCEINELKIPYSSKVRVEELWVEVTDNFGEKHMVSVIYHHPRGNVKLFTEHFEKSLSKMENNRSIKNGIITGDFNIDLNDNTNEYLNFVLKNGFIPTILLSTRVTNRACTLIDHIFIHLETIERK